MDNPEKGHSTDILRGEFGIKECFRYSCHGVSTYSNAV